MTIQQFIEKRSLSRMNLGAWKPAMFLMDDEGEVERFRDQYEFYANADKTVWVSVNRTRARFRICYCDLLTVWTEWHNAASNFELEPIEGVPQPAA
jgi:hypothetical protein